MPPPSPDILLLTKEAPLTPDSPSGKEDGAGYHSFLNDPEGFLKIVKIPEKSSLSFEAEGVPFKAQHIYTEASSQVVLWGILGHLPYSVVSPEKRMALITIIECSRTLPTVIFGIDEHMRIVVRSAYKINRPPTPDYFLWPLACMMQEARPYIRLIGEYL